ncbi:MAG: ABC transporter ATP-binding protein [Oceanospirillaceae bacterium]|nr:ABC transporter ATP-binding protein [Oceanospirillaceae bacterium]
MRREIMSLLTVKDLRVSFQTRNGKQEAVKGVSFELNEGEILGIVGESGSGKSVTCYSLLGLIPMPPGVIESGEALYDGQDLLKLNEKALRQLRGRKINMIFQDPMTALNPYMTVAKQIIEAILVHEKIGKKEARQRAIKALEEVGIVRAAERVDSYPHEFSGGMRQRVMIAMALATEPDILIADEPTTALDVTIQKQILDLLHQIQKRRKLSIIFITHDLAVIHALAHRLIVMEKGHIVEQGVAKDVFANPQHPYTQKLLSAVPDSSKPAEYKLAEEHALLQVKNLRTVFRKTHGPFWDRKTEETIAVNNISLDIHYGEILGLVGESGSGKSTFGRSIMRLVDTEGGEVNLAGRDLLKLHNQELKHARRDFQMIFQDPYASLNPRMTVFDTLAEPLLTHQIVPKKELLPTINRLMDEVGLDRRFIRKYPHEFSGGQRQRIAIARAISVKPKLIIADEPVSALDVTIQAQVLDLLLKLTKDHGITMLFISHDLSVVRYLCDRVAVMQHGNLLELDETEKLYADPQNGYTRKLLSAIPRIDEAS